MDLRRNPGAESDIRGAALGRLDLLRDVVQFKSRFYPSKWAHYELAAPGSFKLLPGTDENLRHLERDYQDTRVMIFGSVPTFAEILTSLGNLEAEINSLNTI